MSLSIGEVVARSGVSHDTRRYWEQEGLLLPPARNAGGHRRYPDSVLDLLAVITDLRSCGFSLAQIRHFLGAKVPDVEPAVRIAAAQARLDDLSAALDERARHLARARRLVRHWRSQLDAASAALSEDGQPISHPGES